MTSNDPKQISVYKMAGLLFTHFLYMEINLGSF